MYIPSIYICNNTENLIGKGGFSNVYSVTINRVKYAQKVI